MEAKRDRGYALEYFESMWHMIQQNDTDDYVIASNETHSVKKFVIKAFDVVGLSAEEYIKLDKRFLRPLDVNYLRGDYSKANQKFSWQPKTDSMKL